jgi:hypothetical protein
MEWKFWKNEKLGRHLLTLADDSKRISGNFFTSGT